jgi:hypothetical protein
MKISWWKWLPFRRWRIVGTVADADEVPDRLPRRGAILVGTDGIPKWIVFDCPCRTGHRIMLNADRLRRPYWSIVSQRRLTIAPSVDALGNGRRCHYFVRHGKTFWTRDSD